MEKADFPIESITIVRDAEGAGGKNQPYRTLNGQGIYRKLPLQVFLEERNDPAAAGKRLAADVNDAAFLSKEIIGGLAQGHSLRELRDLPINWERLKQRIKRYSRQELKLTEEF